jgi:hypothetical protein
MATALALNAISTIVNGQGLAPNATMLQQVSTFQAHTPIVQLANLFAYIQTDANAAANLMPVLSNIGASSPNRWILDLCPADTLIYITNRPLVYGNISGTYKPRLSTTINNQITGPFSGGLSTFANVYTTVSSYAISSFDTVASAFMLSSKTYADSGIGFNGPSDLATGGIGNTGPVIAAAVSNWGTMYDIKNIATAGDTYVFGKNLLGQKLGSYGNLSNQLTSVGLDVTDLTTIPTSTSTTSQVASSTTSKSVIGQVELPSLSTVTTTTVVTGSSPAVVHNIYANVTGSELSAIVSATNFTGNTANIKNLNDFLDINRVVPANVVPVLASLGANTFAAFGQLVHNKIGQGNFKSWAELAAFLSSIVVPSLNNTTTTSSTPLLNNVSALTNGVKGSGQFQNLIISDMLGTMGGGRYLTTLTTLNTYYNSVVTAAVTSAMVNLVASVNQFMANSAAGDANAVVANVTSVTSALNSIPVSANLSLCQTAYTTLWANVQTEITALKSAGVEYSGSATALNSFAQNFPSTAADKDKLQTYQFFANLITNDAAGDTLRAAVAETINTQLLGSKGISLNNNADPNSAISNAAKQNVSLTTYLSQNK